MRSNSIGARIEDLRKKRGETQKDLAEAVGRKNRETINQWESNAREVKGEDIKKLAKHFGVTADYLLGLYSEPTPSVELAEMCEYFGLSIESVELLHGCSIGVSEVLNRFLISYGERFICCLADIQFACEKMQDVVDAVRENKLVPYDEYNDLVKQLYDSKAGVEMALLKFSRLCNKIPDDFGAWDLVETEHEVKLTLDLRRDKSDIAKAKVFASELSEGKNNESSES